MTSAEWIRKVKQHAADLRDLLDNYHPSSVPRKALPVFEITAPGAEEVCKQVRGEIADRESEIDKTPVARFDAAIVAGNAAAIYSLLDSAWFGVPESTSCWHIRGFAEAVDLIDDPPDDLQGEQEC